MKKPHFYKAHSRLGMVNIPNHGTELNLGVEDGSVAVLSPGFLKHFGGVSVTDFTYTLPEDIETKDYVELLAEESTAFADRINSTLGNGETQVVIGGDHSVAFASLMAVLERIGKDKVGYIQFDSHGDLHLFKTSPSGNFHGMWLRPLVGDFDNLQINQVTQRKLRPGQLLFIGNLELEPEEARFFAENNIRQLSSEEFQKTQQKVLAEIKKFVSRFAHLHISFDIDVFHKDIVSATGTPAENGFEPEAIFSALDIIKSSGSLSMDLVEVNPAKSKAEQTITMAQKVLTSVLG